MLLLLIGFHHGGSGCRIVWVNVRVVVVGIGKVLHENAGLITSSSSTVSSSGAILEGHAFLHDIGVSSVIIITIVVVRIVWMHVLLLLLSISCVVHHIQMIILFAGNGKPSAAGSTVEGVSKLDVLVSHVSPAFGTFRRRLSTTTSAIAGREFAHGMTGSITKGPSWNGWTSMM